MRLRRVAAAVLIASLILGMVAWAGSGEGPVREATIREAGVRQTGTPMRRPSTQPPLVTSTAASVSVPPGTSADHEPLVVAREALSAWGRFAVSRDLAEVEPWFDVAGPQFRQFIAEAGTKPAGGAAYRVSFEPLDVDPADPSRIRARVVFVRTGEPSQSFDWWIVLRRREGRWQVWTVEAGAER